MKTPEASRIEQLKRLHARWAAELQHQMRLDPDHAHDHLTDALEDLQRLIEQLEASTPRT